MNCFLLLILHAPYMHSSTDKLFSKISCGYTVFEIMPCNSNTNCPIILTRLPENSGVLELGAYLQVGANLFFGFCTLDEIVRRSK